MPAGFAAALDHFENDVTAPVAPSALATRADAPSVRAFDEAVLRTGAGPVHRQDPHRRVALACGFHDHSAFARTFRAMTGITSIRFRQG